MYIAIRTDSSLKIGSGHVMRCLTFANELCELGHKVVFICKDHDSNLINKITNFGYKVKRLSVSSSKDVNSQLAHAEWLGGTQDDDAEKTILAINNVEVDLIIVDHYAIDEFWHKKIRPHVKNIFVIDDLGDRKHNCDILLDQNLGATKKKYQGLVPKYCELLIGPKFALLRPEFTKWRNKSLERRRYVTSPKNILVTMGGGDPENATSSVVNVLSTTSSLVDVEVNVVLGSQSQHVKCVENAAKKSPLNFKVHIDTKRMAELMANSDLAIGAAGSTSWERCAMGVPSILFQLADNQKEVIIALQETKAAKSCKLEDLESSSRGLESIYLDVIKELREMSISASKLCDGKGLKRVAERILSYA